MSLPPLATVSAMEARLGVDPGSIEGNDLVRAEQALADVSALIRAEAGGMTWVADDGVTITAPEDVVVVALQVALRVYRNPDGYTGESVGDYSWQLGGSGKGGVGIFLSEAERDIIANAHDRMDGAMGFTGSVRTPSAYGFPDDDGIALNWGLD